MSSRWVRELSEQEQLAQNFVVPLLASAKALLILAARSQGPQTASDSHPAPTLFCSEVFSLSSFQGNSVSVYVIISCAVLS